MNRCELHDGLGNQCPTAAVLIVMAEASTSEADIDRALWGAAACDQHAWEATARCALRVQQARGEGLTDPRVVAVVDDAGEQLLELLHQGVTVGDRWPLAKPWVRG